jgi:hypothetical protein
MKLFISHSLSQTDSYIAAILVRQAQAKGITAYTTQQSASLGQSLNDLTLQAIQTSDIVVAIISRDSYESVNVQYELEFAASLNRPVLALVEHGALVQPEIAGLQYVEFTRHNLQPALSEIERILETKKSQSDTSNWLVAGGLALLALYLISKSEP